ncbi:hypothetical protein [Glycomyces salinus]|uniref:hypothetical protein n=1 Tax=Glycomyces salinus TaxID=980294 RepID=UPI0018EAD917|nr:hypothetical protein [Glycomyces salinus]
MSRPPVTADHVERTVRLAVDALRPAPIERWDRRAGPMDCSCWEAADHLCSALFRYASRFGLRTPPTDRSVAIDPGPRDQIVLDRKVGAPLEGVESMGSLLVAMLGTAGPEWRAWHIWGVADPEGFAAMGVVETGVHAWDLAQGLGLEWRLPDELGAPALARLFPEAPSATDPWATLLWATGRGDLPGHGRRDPDWSWHSAPLSVG